MSETKEKKGGLAELWKFAKFLIVGGGSSAVELVVHMVLLNTVFAALNLVPITNSALNFIGIDYKGYLYAYLISTTVGYTIAFIANRKVTFKADANPTFSIVVYVIMVIATIFINSWLGSALTSFVITKGWDGALADILIKVIVMIIPTLWTYPLNRFVIHRKKKPEAETAE